jgi:nitrate/nitrite transport system permease protein
MSEEKHTMVSAVFHSSLDTSLPHPRAGEGRSEGVARAEAAPQPSALPKVEREPKKLRSPIDLRAFWMRVLPPLVGFGLLVLIWELVAMKSTTGFPAPSETWRQALIVFSDPFYSKGPNDQGVGWNVLSSLQRVALGFGLAAAVGIPAGFAIGRFEFLSRMFNPLISLLRPVSPLAWLPIGLLVFKGANPAAIWTIFICSIWPMVINTAVGVQRVPSDYMNVAKVLNLSEWKIFTKILFPRRAALHADGRALGRGHCLAGDRRGRNAHRRRRHRFLGVGRMEQPQRQQHHHRDLRDRHRRPGAGVRPHQARHRIHVRRGEVMSRTAVPKANTAALLRGGFQ